MNGTILLTGRGNKVIQPHVGDGVADVVPVDYVARLIIGCAATLSLPENIKVPKVADIIDPNTIIEEAKPIPIEPVRSHKRSSSQASRMSMRSSIYPSQRMSFFGHTENANERTVPIIYQVSVSNLRPVNWRIGYEAIRQYWIKTTNINLPSSKSYFSPPQRNSVITSIPSSPGLSRARTVMNSLRGYYMNSGPEASAGGPNSTVTPTSTQSSDRVAVNSTSSANNKRNSHRLSRTVDKAAKLAHTMKDNIYSSSSNLSYNNQLLNENTFHLTFAIRNIDVGMEFDPSVIVPEDADGKFWVNYLTNASYGIHYFVCHESNLRLPTPVYGWSCGIQPTDLGEGDEDGSYYQYVFGRQINSAIYSQDQILQRTARMVAHIKGLLMHNTPMAISSSKDKDDAWLTDLDDALDDWCQDNDITTADKERRMALGKWRRKVGSNDESVKVIVLNDKRVNLAITQITQNAGVPRQTAVNEAMKILMRMSERTQLAFVWFTGSFLKSLLDDMFENVRILDESLRAIRQSTMGKRIVYVPVSKSMLDPLLVWYIAIRYHLPVPALACDEMISQMGPISDVYRLAGAYYVKRDKSKRSPLNSAVTAAYTQVLLREHGALAFCLERSRSRTGKFQEAYPDGFVDMVIEATLQTNQSSRNSANNNNANLANRIASTEVNSTPPASPDSPLPSSAVASPTMSIDSLAHNFNPPVQSRKVSKDVIFVPINITYENVPELSHLIDEVLDQQPTGSNNSNNSSPGRTRSSSQSTAPPSLSSSSRPSSMVRPSEAKDRRKTLGLEAPKKGGRVTFGIGPLISVQEVAEEHNRQSTR